MFRFKQFSVEDDQCGMKIGVDSVILGAWVIACTPQPPNHILDIGTGCGVLALMLAQKFGSSDIAAVEMEPDAAAQAQHNFNHSPFSNSFKVHQLDFRDFESPVAFDLIVSNPPYFKETTNQEINKRAIARMSKYLPLQDFLIHASNCLTSNGSIFVIYPVEQLADFNELLNEHALCIHQQLTVYGNPGSKVKRYCFEIKKKTTSSKTAPIVATELLIEHSRGNYTHQYQQLTKDFYLNF